MTDCCGDPADCICVLDDPEIENVAQSVLGTPYFDRCGNEGTLDEVLP